MTKEKNLSGSYSDNGVHIIGNDPKHIQQKQKITKEEHLKYRDVDPFNKTSFVVYDKEMALRFFVEHREWIYFLPKEQAVKLWKIETWSWRIGLLVAGIVMFLYATFGR